MHRTFLFTFSFLFALTSSLHAQTNQFEFFETKIRPVLADNCLGCHNAQKHKGGIRLDRKELVFKASDEPLIVPGQPSKSLLMRAILHQGEHHMPPAPKKQLAKPVLDDFALWIKLGAAWPEDQAKTAANDARQHWAFQPVRKVTPPTPKNKTWSTNPIDAFILTQLEAKDLTPNPPADPRTLIRRLSFDLIGLPPTPEEVDAFIKDYSALSTQHSALEKQHSAVEKLVDRLLASPHYGERWGRHWLDLARYADTKGYVFQEERRYAYAYTYRDYVVKAFNDDLPYDQFVLQQLAADRLVARGEAPASAQAAMGYLTLGRRFLNNIHDITDDRIDVVARGLLGLTVTCARCHDHKYDPISTRDYYGLYGVFTSSIEPKELPLIGEPAQTAEYREFQEKLGVLEKKVADYQKENQAELAKNNRKFRDGLRALQKNVDAFKANSAAAPPRGMALVDGPNPHDARVLLRGNPRTPGPIAPRQFLTILSQEKPRPLKDGSGRLDLAKAIVDKDNPLTARVLVNRLWQHHFGAGLVTTPSDFGVRSDPPSHPDLLDYLAQRFMDDGWSIKKMHKLMLLSQTYRLSSANHAQADAVDPNNRLLAHANRRRLEFEPLRDALLAVSGKLDPKMGGPAVDITTAPYSGRRTLYGFVDRQNLPGLFRTFDFASPDATTARRYETTVPQQALFLLNHPFMLEQVRAVVQRVGVTGEPKLALRRMVRSIYAREADEEEIRLSMQFLDRAALLPRGNQSLSPWECLAQALLLANEFTFID